MGVFSTRNEWLSFKTLLSDHLPTTHGPVSYKICFMVCRSLLANNFFPLKGREEGEGYGPYWNFPQFFFVKPSLTSRSQISSQPWNMGWLDSPHQSLRVKWEVGICPIICILQLLPVRATTLPWATWKQHHSRVRLPKLATVQCQFMCAMPVA